jgi:hypothetical protein
MTTYRVRDHLIPEVAIKLNNSWSADPHLRYLVSDEAGPRLAATSEMYRQRMWAELGKHMAEGGQALIWFTSGRASFRAGFDENGEGIDHEYYSDDLYLVPVGTDEFNAVVKLLQQMRGAA